MEFNSYNLYKKDGRHTRISLKVHWKDQSNIKKVYLKETFQLDALIQTKYNDITLSIN